jgi:hypothetical protein
MTRPAAFLKRIHTAASAVSIRSMAAAGTIKRFPNLITGKMPLLA